MVDITKSHNEINHDNAFLFIEIYLIFQLKTREIALTGDHHSENRTRRTRSTAKMVWKQAKDPKGRVYYYDTVTRATSWTLPEEKEVPQPAKEAKNSENDKKIKEQETMTVQTEDEARAQFEDMLKDHGVDIQWSFGRVMEELAPVDDRYWFSSVNEDPDKECPWEDPVWKQKVWQDYVWGQQSQRLEDHIASFKSLLKQKYYDEGKLKLWHPWSYAKKHVLDMDTDNSFVILDETLQRKLYFEFLQGIREEQTQKKDALKLQATKEMKIYLQSVVFHDDSKRPMEWNQVNTKYLSSDNQRYVANKNFQMLTMEDNLIIYMEILSKYQDDLKQQLKEVEEANYTKDRFARDQFKQLLHGETDDSTTLKIRFNSTWKGDIYPKIQKDKRFLDLVGRHGSSPLDLFYDRLQEIRSKLKAQSSLVRDILIEEGKPVSQLDPQQLKSLLSKNYMTTLSLTGPEDLNELVEFIFDEEKKQQKQLFRAKLVQLLNQSRTNNRTALSWEQVQSRLIEKTPEQAHQWPTLHDKEMRDVYNELIQQHQMKASEPTAISTSRKRPLERVQLDY